MSQQAMFLKGVLNEANKHKRQQKIRYANADQINAVSELVMHILRGLSVKVEPLYQDSNLKSTNFVLLLTLGKVKKRRRQLMMHQLGGSVWQELKCGYH